MSDTRSRDLSSDQCYFAPIGRWSVRIYIFTAADDRFPPVRTRINHNQNSSTATLTTMVCRFCWHFGRHKGVSPFWADRWWLFRFPVCERTAAPAAAALSLRDRGGFFAAPQENGSDMKQHEKITASDVSSSMAASPPRTCRTWAECNENQRLDHAKLERVSSPNRRTNGRPTNARDLAYCTASHRCQ